MIVTLNSQGLKTLAPVQAFVSSNEAISYTLTDRTAAYGDDRTLKQFHYGRCTRADKGVYLINAVDEVTQFQSVFAVGRISEAYLLPAWRP